MRGVIGQPFKFGSFFDLFEAGGLPFAVNEALINHRAEPAAQASATGIMRQLAQPFVAIGPQAEEFAVNELNHVFGFGFIFGQGARGGLHGVAVFALEFFPGCAVAIFAGNGQA